MEPENATAEDEAKLARLAGGRRIDVHHHVVLPEYRSALERAGAADPSRPLGRNFDPAVECEIMDQLGTAASIINPLSAAGVHHGDDANARYLTEATNEALAKFVSAKQDRMGFFAALPLPDLDGALRQMEAALNGLGADGVIFLSNQNGRYIGDPEFEDLYAEMDRRRVIAFVHPARPLYLKELKLDLWPAYVEYPFETTRVAANLIYHGIMARYPNIKWILAHAGGALPYLAFRLQLMEEGDPHSPTFSERVPEGVAAYADQFYFDIALSGAAAPMAALTEMADPTRILFGSDWPYVDRYFIGEQMINLDHAPSFDDETMAAMERDNAVALFPRFGGAG
jgi:predicted TIM-barrel fold metal-dependent hydrolase